MVLLSGSELASALGWIAYKTIKDVVRGDKLYLISRTCKVVVLGCSTIKVIPFRVEIYVWAKIISKGCISFRNICARQRC